MIMGNHNFKKLSIWKKSFELSKSIYRSTEKFPKAEKLGLTSQLRRSAVSIPSNIAEGCGRGTNKQLIYFLNVARGSACELETQILLAGELSLMERKIVTQIAAEVDEVRRMISGFIKSVESSV